ncbi:MAG: hypothetical protein ACR2MG_19265 [Pyrinomonadaceae bacterium]
MNRLKSAAETISSQTWKQTFLYDRYGNRNFDTANTTTLGSCPAAHCNPTIDAANNRFTSGQGYTYDLAGNVISDAQGRVFTYDGENKQTLVKDVNNVTIGEYYYDGDDKRVKKYIFSTQETTVFVYDASVSVPLRPYFVRASALYLRTFSYLLIVHHSPFSTIFTKRLFRCGNGQFSYKDRAASAQVRWKRG